MINKTILLGRLGQNPELKHTPTGTEVCKFSLATNENWIDKQGQKQEKTEWHNITIFGKVGENCSKFLKKGSMVYLEGKNQTSSYEKNGLKMFSTSVIASIVKFLDGSKKENDNNEIANKYPQAQAQTESFKGQSELKRYVTKDDGPSFMLNKDDIPF